MVCCTVGIQSRSFNMKISECLGVHLRTMQRILKELDKFNDDYKDIAIQKPNSDHSDKKRTEFVGEIRAMIDNDPNKSLRFIAKDLAISIQYFLCKIRKGQFLIQAMKDKRKYFSANLVNKFKLPLQVNIL